MEALAPGVLKIPQMKQRILSMSGQRQYLS
jgi:hypothetical protein